MGDGTALSTFTTLHQAGPPTCTAQPKLLSGKQLRHFLELSSAPTRRQTSRLENDDAMAGTGTPGPGGAPSESLPTGADHPNSCASWHSNRCRIRPHQAPLPTSGNRELDDAIGCATPRSKAATR